MNRQMKMKTMMMTLALAGTLALNAADEDQIRYLSAYHPHHHEKVKELGFNLVGGSSFRITWDFVKEKVTSTNLDAIAATARKLEADGIAFIPNFNGQHKTASKAWPRIRKDGQPACKGKHQFVDAAHPDYQASLRKGADEVAKRFAAMGLRNFAGFRGVEEVRLHSEPSFTGYNAAAYRAFAGCDIPDEVTGRAAPHWSKVRGMPESRIVPDEFPLLKYYTWFWQQGDGWSRANDIVREAFQSRFDRPIMSMYAPGLRMPRLGGIGGGNSHLCEWIYLTPVPFVISYAIAELQANARQTGARVISTLDGIVRRSIVAPIGEKIDNPPAWTAAAGKCNYITVPPDFLREGYWLMMSRQTDGIGLSVGSGVFGAAPGEKTWCVSTNPESLVVLTEICRDAAIPLGPLLRNMPERAPETAILESYAGAIFSGQAPAFWETRSRALGRIATAANLAPLPLFEEELVKNGVPDSVKVILADECGVLTDRAAAALERFRARGGRIVGSDILAPGVKADAQLPDCSKVIAGSSGNNGKRGRVTDAEIRTCAAALRAVTGVCPYADSDNAWLLTFVRTWRDSDVVFVVNDKREAGDYVGQWGWVLDKGVANKGTVTVARAAGAVYDLVRHEPVPFASADGRTRIDVSFSTSDGKALMIVPKPLAKLSVASADETLSVTSPDKGVLVPFGVLDANGKGLRYGIVRDGRWNGRLPAGAAAVLNLANGERTSL